MDVAEALWWAEQIMNETYPEGFEDDRDPRKVMSALVESRTGISADCHRAIVGAQERIDRAKEHLDGSKLSLAQAKDARDRAVADLDRCIEIYNAVVDGMEPEPPTAIATAHDATVKTTSTIKGKGN